MQKCTKCQTFNPGLKILKHYPNLKVEPLRAKWIPFERQRKLPMIGWVLVVGNAIILFYVTVYPGFKVADQNANPPNSKGMFTFDGLYQRCIKPNPMS